jgi:uncharacterized protein (DUF2062 family)
VNTNYQFFRKLYTTRVLIPVSNIRKQGFSPETLALSISIGIIGGAFPAIGFASYICLLLTLVFKQNIIIVQVVNWLVYPLQILLIIPLMKLGNSIFTGGELTITLHQVVSAFQSGIMNGIQLIGIISLYGIIAWAIIAIPTLIILYSLFLIIFRYFNRVKLKIRLVVVNNPQDQISQVQPVNSSLILETLPAKNNGL